jgi:hypothetical protein
MIALVYSYYSMWAAQKFRFLVVSVKGRYLMGCSSTVSPTPRELVRVRKELRQVGNSESSLSYIKIKRVSFVAQVPM